MTANPFHDEDGNEAEGIQSKPIFGSMTRASTTLSAQRFGILTRELEAKIERNANRRAIRRRLRRPVSRAVVQPPGLAGEPETVEAFAIGQGCAVACTSLSSWATAFGSLKRRASHSETIDERVLDFDEAGVQVPERDFMPVDVGVQTFIFVHRHVPQVWAVFHIVQVQHPRSKN